MFVESAARRDIERAELAQVQARLERSLPGVPAAEIEREIGRAHASFADAPVRQFVMVLIERQVRSRFAPALA